MVFICTGRYSDNKQNGVISMRIGWRVIWHKHHWSIVIFMLATLALTGFSVAALYSAAAEQGQTLREYVRQITFGQTSPFANVLWLLILTAVIASSKIHQDLQQAGVSDQDRWRLMGQLALGGALWSATLDIVETTLMYRFYTDTVTAAWPLPLLGAAYWLIHLGFYWAASLLTLWIVQWPHTVRHRLYYVFLGFLTIQLIGTSFRTNALVITLSHAYTSVERFLNRTPVLVLLIMLGVSSLLAWWVQDHPLPASPVEPRPHRSSSH
jgi:hypothetical protein